MVKSEFLPVAGNGLCDCPHVVQADAAGSGFVSVVVTAYAGMRQYEAVAAVMRDNGGYAALKLLYRRAPAVEEGVKDEDARRQYPSHRPSPRQVLQYAAYVGTG